MLTNAFNLLDSQVGLYLTEMYNLYKMPQSDKTASIEYKTNKLHEIIISSKIAWRCY